MRVGSAPVPRSASGSEPSRLVPCSRTPTISRIITVQLVLRALPGVLSAGAVLCACAELLELLLPVLLRLLSSRRRQRDGDPVSPSPDEGTVKSKKCLTPTRLFVSDVTSICSPE